MNRVKWTKEKCKEEALMYETRLEFMKNSRLAYSAAQRRGWLSEICEHMKKYGNKMYRCIYVYEFSDNHAYIGLSFNLDKRKIARTKQENDAVTKYIKITNLTPKIKQLSDYVHVDVASVLENDCIETYRMLGWKMLNKRSGGALGSNNIYWTKELCQKESIKFNSRSEFYYKCNKTYAAALRYGWLDEICSHMDYKIHKWTYDEVYNISKQFNSRYEFQKNNKAAYVWAIRHNVLDDICEHMQLMLGNNQHGNYSGSRIS